MRVVCTFRRDRGTTVAKPRDWLLAGRGSLQEAILRVRDVRCVIFSPGSMGNGPPEASAGPYIRIRKIASVRNTPSFASSIILGTWTDIRHNIPDVDNMHSG